MLLAGLHQWCSQDITVARAQHGHTTFVLTSTRSAEAYRGVWGHPPPENLRNFRASQVGSEQQRRNGGEGGGANPPYCQV